MILTAVLVMTLAAPPATASSPAPVPRAQEKAVQADPLDAEYDRLTKEAQAASEAYQEKRKTDPKAPRWEAGMWDKFQALADKGHGRALLWLAQSAQYKYESKKEATVQKLELYGRLIENFGSTDWSDDIVGYTMREKQFCGMQELD